MIAFRFNNFHHPLMKASEAGNRKLAFGRIFWLFILVFHPSAFCAEPFGESLLNRRARIDAAIQVIPFDRLERQSAEVVRDVLSNPSFYRQLPPKTLDCDPQLMKFMVRHPEVMVNIWEMVGITNITAQRTGARTFYADDGAGTKCNCELVYSDDSLHIYYGTGNYDGILFPRTIKGRVVCLLRSQSAQSPVGHSGFTVNNTMDVFLKVDNLGADLLTRTLGPLVARVTEHNFEETSKFVSQLSEFCANYPNSAQNLADHLHVSDESIRREFSLIASRIGGGNQQAPMLNQSLGQVQQPVYQELDHPDQLRIAERVSADRSNARKSIANSAPIERPNAEFSRSEPMDSTQPVNTPHDLKASLGHIRLATLPELVSAEDLPDQSAGELDSPGTSRNETQGAVLHGQLANPESNDLRSLPTNPPQPNQTNASGTTTLPPSGIAPKRASIQLRR